MLNYSASFKLDHKETALLIRMLTTKSAAKNSTTSYGYEGVTLLLLNALSKDVTLLLRAVIADQHAKRKVFSSGYYKKLVTLIKEVIILNGITENTEPDGFVSVDRLAKLNRFRLLEIDRNMIHRTIRKYNIKYTKRKYNKINN